MKILSTPILSPQEHAMDKNIIFLMGTYVLGIAFLESSITPMLLFVSAELVKLLKLILKTLCSMHLYLSE